MAFSYLMLDLEKRTAVPSTIDRAATYLLESNVVHARAAAPVVLAIVDNMDMEPGAVEWQAGDEWCPGPLFSNKGRQQGMASTGIRGSGFVSSPG